MTPLTPSETPRHPRRVQSAPAALTIRPAHFGWNAETAPTNAFQPAVAPPAAALDAPARARTEADALAAALAAAGVEVFELDEPGPDPCPDAVFPNNWVSLHHDGTVVLYPMQAPSRRRERRMELLVSVESLGGRAVTRLVDLTHHERHGRFLEGTGSVVFDHAQGLAHACVSPRTSVEVLDELCDELGYEPCPFEACDASGVPVYHTNVLLSVGTRTAIACADAIASGQRDAVLQRLAAGRTLVTIDRRQMAEFAGNALEFATHAGRAVLALSARAWASLDAAQRDALSSQVDEVVVVQVPTIEVHGGGSVRCMLAEVFLPRAAGRGGAAP
jgi:hypothetical protein